ncbi:MAG: UDP-N-acetylmuramate--L-alanine ligase [Chloroflexota bacterium]|nr:UDP-N-acetylmuramate--L-alanine ligase [Chloroflexota bacterium]
MKHVHFIGIGGTGLSAIARVLLERGYTVSGSDLEASPLFEAISKAGAQTFLGHAAEQINGAEIVIRSSAIPENNPEVTSARALGIPVLKRSEFLEELTRFKETLAVAGTHGKTTTTAMLVWILDQLNAEPSFILGALVNQLNCNAQAGSGPYFVIEADEYDRMFLGLSPKIAVITNIEHDHPDCFPTPAIYHGAFKAFLKKVRPDGCALICCDDPGARRLMEEMISEDIKLLGYGTHTEADYQAKNIAYTNGSPVFKFVHQGTATNVQALGNVSLNVPGEHNILNATAALGVIHQLGLPMNDAIDAISSFNGTGRRFEVLGEAQGIVIIDDYGHHPTEIAATLQAARSRYPDRRIWAIWQPHTYSRTRMLKETFIPALNFAEKVIILAIYAAREENPGYSAETIANALPTGKAKYIQEFSQAISFLLDNLQPNDVAIVFSAGDATKISKAVLNRLLQKEAKTNRNESSNA